MGQITAEVMIARLAEWGVDTVFGLPGGRRGVHLAEVVAAAVRGEHPQQWTAR